MKPKELFGVAVRVMGLGSMLVGIYQILVAIVTMIITSSSGNVRSSSGNAFFYIILFAGIFIGLGFALMKLAPAIERYFYPDGE